MFFSFIQMYDLTPLLQHLAQNLITSDANENIYTDHMTESSLLSKVTQTLSGCVNFGAAVLSCANENAQRYLVDYVDAWINERVQGVGVDWFKV